jgi:hypothetical protein
MRPDVVAEPEIVHQRHPQLPPADKDLRVDEFVLQLEPLLLEENTVRPAAAAVHADPDPAVPQRGGETGRSELRTLARVENLRRALAQGGFQTAKRIQVSRAGENSQLNSERLNQSIPAIRQKRPGRIGTEVMSAVQPRLGRSVAMPRSNRGWISCPGAGRLCRGFGHSVTMPPRRIRCCTRLRFTASIAAMRRLPRNSHAIESSSSRRSRATVSSLSARGSY